MNVLLGTQLNNRLRLTPQLQQLLSLLPLSNLELKIKLQNLLETNPFLEEQPISSKNDPLDITSYSAENLTTPHSTTEHDTFPPLKTYSNPDTLLPTNWSLKEHLHWQLSASGLSEQEYLIGTAIIDEISEEGYLHASFKELEEHLTQTIPVTIDEIAALLHLIQDFEPTGVGARDLQECLLLQLQLFPKETPYLAQTKHVVQYYFSLLTDPKRLKSRLKFSQDIWQAIMALLQTLDPKPGLQFQALTNHSIIPDMLTYKEQSQWKVVFNPKTLFSVQINQQYLPLLRKTMPHMRQYLREQLIEAKDLIKSIKLRHQALLEITRLIVEKQGAFLEYGTEAMQPLTLRDLSDKTGFHTSTLSRMITHKYLHTPRGVFALQFFFSRSLDMPSGETYSKIAIQSLIKKYIETENKKKPLTDNQITRLLAEDHIIIARRTVTLYREKLAIPPAHARKLFTS